MECPNSITATHRTPFASLRFYAFRRTYGIAPWDKTLEQRLPAMEAEVMP